MTSYTINIGGTIRDNPVRGFEFLIERGRTKSDHRGEAEEPGAPGAGTGKDW